MIRTDALHNEPWHDKLTKWVCAQRRLGSSAQSDQSPHCPHEESWGPQLPIKRTAKTLIRLGGCPGWSESSLGTQSFCWFCHEAALMLWERVKTGPLVVLAHWEQKNTRLVSEKHTGPPKFKITIFNLRAGFWWEKNILFTTPVFLNQ